MLKALALGADVVCVGRPTVWGLACGGEVGVGRMLSILTEELKTAMMLAGREAFTIMRALVCNEAALHVQHFCIMGSICGLFHKPLTCASPQGGSIGAESSPEKGRCAMSGGPCTRGVRT